MFCWKKWVEGLTVYEDEENERRSRFVRAGWVEGQWELSISVLNT